VDNGYGNDNFIPRVLYSLDRRVTTLEIKLSKYQTPKQLDGSSAAEGQVLIFQEN